MQNHAQLIF